MEACRACREPCTSPRRPPPAVRSLPTGSAMRGSRAAAGVVARFSTPRPASEPRACPSQPLPRSTPRRGRRSGAGPRRRPCGARLLCRFRQRLEAATGQIASAISREYGKTLNDARAEIARGLEVVEFACAVPGLLKREYSEGVVAGVTPLNFPAMVPLWMFPLALKLAPGGDLLTANGDAVHADPRHPSEIVEFTKGGQFVREYNVDASQGGAFGIDAPSSPDARRNFAVVDDVPNNLSVYRLAPDAGEDD